MNPCLRSAYQLPFEIIMSDVEERNCLGAQSFRESEGDQLPVGAGKTGGLIVTRDVGQPGIALLMVTSPS